MVAIATLIQHCTESPKHCCKEQEVEVVLERNKIFLIYKYFLSYFNTYIFFHCVDMLSTLFKNIPVSLFLII